MLDPGITKAGSEAAWCAYRCACCRAVPVMLANAGAGPAPAAGPEFVEGWIVAQLLGEGAYGE